MNTRKQLLLGALFLVALFILGYYTLFMTDFRLFGERVELVVRFPDGSGLRQGDAVHVAGLRRGRVESLAYDAQAPKDRWISAKLLMDQEIELREGFSIQITDATLLGGHVVKIDPGPPSAPRIDANQLLLGTVGSNAIAALGQVIDENREQIKGLVGDVREMVSSVRRGEGAVGKLLFDPELGQRVEEGVASARDALADAAELTRGVREGKGVVGRLFKDEELWARVEQISRDAETVSANAAKFSAQLESGPGVLPRLVNDGSWSEKVGTVVDDLASISAKLDRGEGTVAQLISSPELAERLRSVAEKLDSIVGKVDAGEGTLAKLVNDDSVYALVEQIVADLAVVADTVKRGEGSLGKLMMSDELYAAVMNAVGTVTGSLEEFREAAPITTFTSVLFAAF